MLAKGNAVFKSRLSIVVWSLIVLGTFSSALGDWPGEKKIEASDGMDENMFGCSVSISGDVCVVGAYRDNERRGAVYVYRFDGNDWIEEQKLTASDEFIDNNFGYSVCVDGNICAVGVLARATNGGVYIFRNTPVGWIEEQKLPLPAEAKNFGQAVAIERNALADIDYCIVGDPGVWVDDTPKGAAYTYWYDQTAGSWQFGQKLVASDFENSNLFGLAVSISGGLCVIGMPGDDVNAVDSGSAYIFRNTPIGWIEEQKLSPAGVRDDWERYGASVSIDGHSSRCVIGSPGYSMPADDAGAVYYYHYYSGSWLFGEKLQAPDAAADDAFGGAVSISGDTFIVGSSGNDDLGPASGSAYVYRRDNNLRPPWKVKKLTASDGEHHDYFGESVSIAGNNVVVGAPASSKDPAIGSAHIYDLTCPSADLTGDCYVDFNDFATVAGQWLDGLKPAP